jgi:hypothetical protein
MENKCKNCMSFSAMSHIGDGMKGCCGRTGDLVVHSREDICNCGMFMEMPKIERLIRRIEFRLHNWVRERDDMFRRSMEIVGHICELFKQGEFKVFDAVKSTCDMKYMMYHGANTEISIHRVWTYHCPWNEDIEHYIAITTDGKMISNIYDNTNNINKFITEIYDIEDDYESCDRLIDRIRDYCVIKAITTTSSEVEINKCVEESPNTNKTVCW